MNNRGNGIGDIGEIHNSNIVTNSPYNIKLSQDKDIDANNNWWGTTNKTLINENIFDYYNDYNLGKVIYDPFLLKVINISNSPPIANAGPDQNVKVNQTVYFNGNKSYDPDGDTLSYKWDFGDGSSTGWSGSSLTSHNYKTSGNYEITLTVTDGVLTDSDACFINVTGVANQPPVVNAGPDQEVKVGQTVYFDGSKSYDPDNDTLTYKWDFDDGSSTSWSNSSNTSHSFTKEGNYNVTLEIFDGKDSDTDFCFVEVKNESAGPVNGTKVSGIISKDTTWTEANSPYIITGNILVESGIKLVIEPGVTIKFEKNLYMRVDGTLFAIGTESKMITFTANKTSPTIDKWKSIIFSGKSKNSTIQYCNIKYGTKAIDSNFATLQILNNKFSGNYQSMELKNGNYNISNNIISNNSFSILLQNGNCTISNNILSNNNNGILLYDCNINVIIKDNIIKSINNSGIGMDSSNGLIHNNYISYCGGGIYCSGNDIQINNNVINNNDFGIDCQAGKINITNNIIEDNKKQGIHIFRQSSNYIFNNNISRNGIGFLINYTGFSTINYNNIFENLNYGVYNLNENQLNLQNNWWGTTNTSIIDKKIYDYYDDFELGKVIYKPFLTSPVNISIEPPPINDSNQTPPNNDNNQTHPQNETQPKIAELNIPNGSSNVSINTSQIKIVFSKPMNRSTVEATLKISPTANYTLYWGKGDTELLIVFNEPLVAETEYSVTIDTSAKDAWGNNLKNPFELKFTTEKASKKTINGDDYIAENLSLIVIIIVLLVIILIIVLAFIVRNRQRIEKESDTEINDGRHEMRGGEIADEYYKDDSDEVVNNLIKEALKTKKPSDFGVNQQEMLNKIKIKYRNGKISKETYSLIENKLTVTTQVLEKIESPSIFN